MLLKNADNKEAQSEILKNLLEHEKIPPNKKLLIEKELRNTSIGIATEKQAAYEIDFHFGATENLMVLHDLRLEINSRVAQIDHLLINRALEVYVLETKTFSTGISINENGEFTTTHDKCETGIPSPVEQNARHIAVLRDAFKQIGLPTRLGIPLQPSFHPLVLVSPKAVIRRPKSSTVDLNSIIKSDQFFSWYNQKIDETKIGDVIGILKVCSSATIKIIGDKLAALHRPGRIDYVKKFGLADYLLSKEVPTTGRSIPAAAQEGERSDIHHSSRYFCAACRKTIAEVVAKYCWNNKPRFGGKAYCRGCQNRF